MRKLASVQKIKEIIPIDGADRIELAKVLGWQCVVKKGEFKVGDYGVYFEIDSFLPIEERFEFLRSSSYKKSELLGEGFRLKTQKMRGEISQGLLMPCELFPELWYDPIEKMNCVVPSEGQDVTELLGVRKWEVPEMATTGGTIIGQLPYFIPHTDETRIQNIPDIADEFGEEEYYISTKMDGSSHSIGINAEDMFYVTGHNYQYKDDGKSSFYEYVKRHEFESLLFDYKRHIECHEITIQGEYCGAGIQSNRLKLAAPEWYVFNVEIDGTRVDLDEMLEVAKYIGAKTVPIEERGVNLKEKYPNEASLLKRAEGQYPNGGPKEGIVIRPVEPLYSKTIGGNLSFKVINNKYLLKHSD